jgi:hypothetical protein
MRSSPLGHVTFAIPRESQDLIVTSTAVISDDFDTSHETSTSDQFYDSTIHSFSSNLWTSYFTRSSPLAHVTFAIPRESQDLIVTSTAIISDDFDISHETSTSDQLCESATLLKASISSSPQGVRQAEGSNATRTTLVAISSFVLLAIVGVIVFLAFRGQIALVSDSETSSGNSTTGTIDFLGTGNNLTRLVPVPAARVADPPESGTAATDPRIEGNPRLEDEDESDVDSMWPKSQYLEGDLQEGV